MQMNNSQIGTLVLDANDVTELIRRLGIESSIKAMMQGIDQLFRRWNSFDKSARSACHSTVGVIELMPVADDHQYAFKYVNGHPGNTRIGLPTVMAFGVLADVATGTPVLLAELTLVTALRTAAMSALAAQRLARKDSRVMALIGNGAQAEFQAVAFRDGLGIRELRLFDVDARATAKLVGNLQGRGLSLKTCRSAREAACGADIITTVTADKTRATILTREMVAQGQHINAVGGDCPGKTELHPGVLSAAEVFVEYEPQSRIEGDIQQMPADFPVTEFWRVLTGDSPGRCDPHDITVFDSVGFALEDMAALQWLLESARTLRLGRPQHLVLNPRNPKDLFGMVVPCPDFSSHSFLEDSPVGD